MNFKSPSAPRSRMLSKSLRVALPLLLAAMAITLPRCGQTPTSSGPAAGTFTNVYSIISTSNCVQCHKPSTESAAGNSTLDFTSATTTYSSLTSQSVTSTSFKGTCGTVKIVDQTTPANSYLLAIFTTADQVPNFVVPGCTPDNTHLNGTSAITADELTTITAWVNAKAPNN